MLFEPATSTAQAKWMSTKPSRFARLKRRSPKRYWDRQLAAGPTDGQRSALQMSAESPEGANRPSARHKFQIAKTSNRSQLVEMPTRDQDRPNARRMSPEIRDTQVGRHALPGRLGVPSHPRGHVIFAHGSGSSRLSLRNTHAAQRLRQSRYATLLFDLLTSSESDDRRNVFDIPLLASRVVEAITWAHTEPRVAGLTIGLFGASTGAAAAIVAATQQVTDVRAVVSRGGRPDLAKHALDRIAADTAVRLLAWS